MAHVGELMRERGRALAASEEYGKAHLLVGDKYESISNKYALALLELRRVDEAEQVLQGALRLHPGSPTTNVHLGRIYLFKKQFERARAAYRSALASDPFDEEIHLSLVRIETALGAKNLAQRARNAAIVLTGLPAAMVDRSGEPDMSEDDLKVVEELASARRQILDQIEKRVVGQREVIDHLLISLFSRGHCLFVGVPGLAKTLLISTLAEVLNLTFNRVQFTPDLMPSDITGTDILEEDRTTGRRKLRFMRGPIFANIILADEVNRTPPKTQAALLQAMQEYRVTAGGETYPLDLPFLVFATQNPIEQDGTYPLPEAQLDRFMFLVDVGYPSAEEEIEIVKNTTGSRQVALKKVLSPEKIMALQDLVRRVPVPDHVVQYAVALVRNTRPKEPNVPEFIQKSVAWGA